MTQMVEFELAKVLERMEQKLDRLVEAQFRLEGKVETLQVEVQNIKEDVKEIKTEQKAIRAEVAGWYKWVIVLIVGSGLSLGTLLLKAFDFFPKA